MEDRLKIRIHNHDPDRLRIEFPHGQSRAKLSMGHDKFLNVVADQDIRDGLLLKLAIQLIHLEILIQLDLTVAFDLDGIVLYRQDLSGNSLFLQSHLLKLAVLQRQVRQIIGKLLRLPQRGFHGERSLNCTQMYGKGLPLAACQPDILIGDGITHRFPDRDHLTVFYQDLQFPVYVAVEADSFKAEFALARISGPRRGAPDVHRSTVEENVYFLYSAFLIQFLPKAVVNKPPVVRWKRFALFFLSHVSSLSLSRDQCLRQFLRLPVR